MERSKERSQVNTQTIYIAPKSTHEIRRITTPEPVWGPHKKGTILYISYITAPFILWGKWNQQKITDSISIISNTRNIGYHVKQKPKYWTTNLLIDGQPINAFYNV